MIYEICHPYNFSEENQKGGFGRTLTHRIFGSVYNVGEVLPG